VEHFTGFDDEVITIWEEKLALAKKPNVAHI
jgi:hypothetical protein